MILPFCLLYFSLIWKILAQRFSVSIFACYACFFFRKILISKWSVLFKHSRFYSSYTHIRHSWILLLHFDLTTTNINPLTHLSCLNTLDDDHDGNDPIFVPRDWSLLIFKSRLKYKYICETPILDMISFLEWKVEVLTANCHCWTAALLYLCLSFSETSLNYL